jgi:ribonuclease PH
MRPSKRKNNQMRDLIIEPGYLVNNPFSCMIKLGNTHVICSATLDEDVPRFLRKTGKGWLTAEYGMLPRSTPDRMKREASQGKQSGRTQEIQRLIGRSLRSVVNTSALGERQIMIDCDVINADGGTRTASITGGYVALQLLIHDMINRRLIRDNPLKAQVAAISCGIYNGEAVLDLDYPEDSEAEIDGNFVFTSDGGIVEIQASAESKTCSDEQFQEMLGLAKDAMQKLFAHQTKALLNI